MATSSNRSTQKDNQKTSQMGQAVANDTSQLQEGVSTPIFVDNRPETIAQRKVINTVKNNAPSQLKREEPVISGNAAKANNGDVNLEDEVATGPLRQQKYTVTVTAPKVDLASAITAIKDEYETIGVQTNRKSYLSNYAVEKDADQSEAIYDHVAEDLMLGGFNHNPYFTLRDLTKPALEHLRDKDYLNTIDPFLVEIKATYNVDKEVSVLAQFSEGQKGYIIHVKDSGKAVDSKIFDRPNLAGEFPLGDDVEYKDTGKTVGRAKEVARDVVGPTIGHTSTYSNVHHSLGTDSVGTEIGNIGSDKSRATNEAGVDAVTKAIAEGGRWKCVGALGTSLRNDSLFYTAHQGGFKAVSFKVLWGKWKAFKTEFGISDQTVITKLKGNSGWIQTLDAEPNATGYHYNLDAHAIR